MDTRLDLKHYLPFYVVAIANRWTATSSRTYLREFGIGIVEWRIIASLGAISAGSSMDVVNLTGTDAALISRAMRGLEQKKLVVPVEGRFVGRTKPYKLTKEGLDLFDQIREIALGLEQKLLATLNESERTQLIQLLMKLHEQLPTLQEP